MSIYGGDFSSDLYETGPPPQQKAQEAPKSADPAIDPQAATSEALQLIANPVKLASDVLTQDPATSKLPLGLAIFGTCIAAIVIAAHFDGGGEK